MSFGTWLRGAPESERAIWIGCMTALGMPDAEGRWARRGATPVYLGASASWAGRVRNGLNRCAEAKGAGFRAFVEAR